MIPLGAEADHEWGNAVRVMDDGLHLNPTAAAVAPWIIERVCDPAHAADPP